MYKTWVFSTLNKTLCILFSCLQLGLNRMDYQAILHLLQTATCVLRVHRKRGHINAPDSATLMFQNLVQSSFILHSVHHQKIPKKDSLFVTAPKKKAIHFSDILRIQTVAVTLKENPELLSFSTISESPAPEMCR